MAHLFSQRDETAPMIAGVGGKTLSSTVAALIVERPHLGHRLALAQRRVVHGLSAYIHHALEQSLDAPAIAAEVDVCDIRDLLARAISNRHPRLYGMLDRLGDQAMDLAFYRRMNDLLWGAASDLLLACELVNERGLGMFGTIAKDPVLLAAHKAIGNNKANLNVVISAVAFIRASGLAVDVELLPTGSSWRALKRRITTDLSRASAPPLRFRQPDGWRHVETMSEVLRIGTEMENCVASFGGGGGHHLFNFMTGIEVFLISEAEPFTLAAIQDVGPGLWQITQMEGAARESRTSPQVPELREPLNRVLAEVGHTLLETAPVDALQSIHWRAEGAARALGEDAESDEAA